MSRTPSPEERRRSIQGEEDTPPRKIKLTRASTIQPEPVVWAWEDGLYGRIPAGSLGLFAGREGTGKSCFLVWLTARITTGTLPGAWYGQPRPVIYVAAEDSWEQTIVPRLIAAGADLDLVYRAEVETVDEPAVMLSLPADTQLLTEAITGHGVGMVVLDPLMSAISDRLDTHVEREVRRALDPLAKVARDTGAVLAGIAHFNKSSGTDASSLITASGAFKNVARFIFAFATDPSDGSQVITQTKNNLGHADLPSLAYQIGEATIPTGKGVARVGRFDLEGETDRTVRDILAASSAGEPGQKAQAEEYLRKALAGGPRHSKEIEEEAREAHGISPRTLKRARSDLRIPARKLGTHGWWIALPHHEGDLNNLDPETLSPAKSAKGAKGHSPGPDGTLGTLPSCQKCGQPAGPGGILCPGCHATINGGKGAKDASGHSPGPDGTVGTLPSCALCGGPLPAAVVKSGERTHSLCFAEHRGAPRHDRETCAHPVCAK